jgi:cytidylate kinase
MAIVDAAVVDTLEAGVDTIVCGHVHTARDEVFELSDGRSGRLVVMADFESTGSHAIFRDGELSLVPESRSFARPIVTLDGPAGSGKSSVARELARRLAFVHLDSGALYRAIAAAALDRGTPLTDDALGALAVELDLSIDDAGVSSHGQRIPDARLRGADVSAHVSQVSAHPQVRAAVLPTQRAVAERGAGVVAEGRDMGTVVFPEATFRIWLDASPEVRAARRMAQNAGEGRDLETVTAALRERDERDSSRSVAPLAAPEGGLRMDTSDMSREQVVDRLVALVLCGGLAEAPQDGG